MSEKAEPRKYSLKLKEISICIVDKNDVEKSYTMVGLSGKQRAKYLNRINEHVTIGEDGTTTVDDFEGLQEGLLSECLKDEHGKLVALDVLLEYPSDVLSDLFDEAQKVSGLDKGAKATAKKD